MGELRDTVTSGDRIEALRRLRNHLAERLEAAEDERVIAPIAKQLSDVMRELDVLSPPKQESAVDDLAARRFARRQGAEVPPGTASG